MHRGNEQKTSKLLRIWQYFSTIVGLIFRHPIVGVAVLPINSEGDIVLVQRRDNKKWCFPGGFLDWGESIRGAAARELREETGLILDEVKYMLGVYSDPQRDPRVHSICITLVAQVSGQYAVEDKGEVLGVEAFSLASLPLSDMAHDHGEQLNDYLEGKSNQV